MTLKSPGVEVKVVDNSDFVSAFASTAYAILVKSNKGPLEVTPITSQNQFIKLYGTPDIDVSESHYHALKVLETDGRLLYCKRVQNNAEYAGCIFYQDTNKNPTKIESVDFPYGTLKKYDEDGFRVVLLNLNRFLVNGDKLSITLNDSDGNSEIVEQDFEETSNNTLQLFANKLAQKIKEVYNTEVGVQVKKDTSKNIQSEIYKIICDEVSKDSEKLECVLSNPVVDVEHKISIHLTALSDDILLTSNENSIENILQDYKNQIETSAFDAFLTADIDVENNKLVLTATSSDSNYFSSYSAENIDVDFNVIASEFEPTLSFNIPQIAEKISVSSNYTQIDDILLDFSTKLATSYSNYLTTVINSEDHSLTLISKKNYNEYFSNIDLKDVTGSIEKIQEGFGENSNKQIIITAPVSSIVLYQNYNITNLSNISEEQEIIQNTELFNVFAENPGKWGNDIGVAISVDSNDLGTKEIYSLSFKRLVTGVQFSGSFDLYQVDEDDTEIDRTRKTYNINTVTYFESDNQFFTDIKNEIQNLIKIDYNNYEGVVIEEDSKILLQSPKAGVVFDLTNINVVGIPGVNNPELNIIKNVYNIKGKDTFSINIYEQSDLSNILETYNGSLYDIKDASNNQLNISEVVNISNPSNYIRIKQFNKSKDSGLEVLYSTNINMLNGGDNGDTVTAGDYNKAMQDFNSEDYDIYMFVDDGFNDVVVKQNLSNLADRIDSFSPLSYPKNKVSNITQMLNYRNNEVGINSCSSALFGPTITIFDDYSGKQIELTTGGWVVDRMAYVEANYGRHQATAGQKGSITGILGLNKNYKKSEYDELYPNQINLIRNINSAFQIDGIKTLQRKETALQNIPVVLMRNTIKKNIKRILNGFLFELNLPDTRSRVWNACNDYMSNLKVNSMITNYKITCDDTNNSNADLDAGRLNVLIKFIPVGSIEYVVVTLSIEKNGTI